MTKVFNAIKNNTSERKEIPENVRAEFLRQVVSLIYGTDVHRNEVFNQNKRKNEKKIKYKMKHSEKN